MYLKFSKIMLWFILVGVLMVGAACGGGEATQLATPEIKEPVASPIVDATEVKPTEDSIEEATSGAINSIKDAKNAIIQIEAQGSFIDPQVGQLYNTAGRGSGFIIDPSGIAVTNNHVVTGAALLKVWIGGDQSKSYNAKVLGVSECADLAVIDIEGDGFPYLEWYDNPIEVGKEIYVAGFPLGDPEYSLTSGIISKAKAGGETSWASVDSAIEYDATTNPGNSGGPVLSPQAKIIGVHYAGNSDTRQAYGISRDLAKTVIETLKQGENLDAIGINGQAVSNEDGSLTGVWVASVDSGSPADEAGIKGGDIILTMENLVLSTDGTMADYCDILRSHSASDTLSIEVLRFATGEILEGQLNGRDLEITSTIDVSGGEQGTGGDQGGEQTSVVFNPDASASGDVYYSTEFDEPLNDWSYFFTNGDDSKMLADINGSGQYRVELNDTDTWLYLNLELLDVADVRINTIAENLGRNNNNVSLICRYSDAGWYEFNVANNGEYTIFRYDPTRSKDYRYIALFTGASTAIQMGLGTNEITAICNGDQLTLGINGQEVRSIRDRSLKSGQVGFSVSSFNVTPIILEFEYFYATVP